MAKLETLARDKQNSLLRKFVSYGRRKYYNIVPCLEGLPGAFELIIFALSIGDEKGFYKIDTLSP
jgi:hypothetical protein